MLDKLLTPSRLIVLSICLSLLGGELLLRTTSTELKPRSGWLARSPRPPTNELGYRGRRFLQADVTDQCRVALVGDSQVECETCPPTSTPEMLLEEALARQGLRIRVISAGAGGYGQDQQLLALQALYKTGVNPATIVLWQTFTNDVWNNAFPTHWPGSTEGTPKPTYWLLGPLLLGPTERIGDPPFRSELASTLLRAAGVGRDRLWEWLILPPSLPGEPTNHGDLPVVSKPADEDLQKEKSHFALMRVPASARADYSIRLTRALLSRMRDLAKEHDSQLVIFQEDRFSGLANELPQGDFYFLSQERYFRANLQQAIRNRDRTNEGFTFINIPIRIANWTISNTDLHLNLPANKDVLEQLAEQLVRRGIVGADGTCRAMPQEHR